MFCYQCEQTLEGGCNKKIGVCGKNEDVASLQDIAIFGLKGAAAYAHHARELGAVDPEVDSIVADTLYSTLTNVNFRLNDNVDTVLKVGEATMKVMDLLDKAHIDAVKSGKIKRFFVIAGCDAPGSGGDYFRELAELVPKDCVILTTSCGKFRFNDLDFGDIDGIPRYIDLGQCNNSISCVKIAVALATAFDCSVNELPLTIALSWFEQKAVAILLGLFSLGVKNVYLGPKPPEFVTPAVLKVLQDNFNLKMTGDAATDMRKMLG